MNPSRQSSACLVISLPYGRTPENDRSYAWSNRQMTAVRHASSARAAERRRSLIEAAYRIIAEQGLKGLRTRAVAAQVGLTHATLHYYFPTKEALIQAVIDYAVFQRLLAGIPLFPEDRVGTPVEQLRALLLGLAQSMREDMTNVRVLYELILHTQHNPAMRDLFLREEVDRKSTRLNSSHQIISYAVFCLKKKK